MNKKREIFAIAFSVVVFTFVLCTRFFKIEIEQNITFLLMPFIYIINFMLQILLFCVSVWCVSVSKGKRDIFVWRPLIINILIQILLFGGFTQKSVEKLRFSILLNQYEETVAQIESGSLIADEEYRIELPNDDSYLRLAIDNEVILIKNDGKIYVYFYTSTLMLNNSTGYLKQVALAENTVQEETDINILEKYKGQWYKGATY